METIHLLAKVKVCLSEYSMIGRDGYKSGVRPNHMMPGRDYAFMGQLDFIDHEDWLKPGECCNAIGNFLIADQDLEYFIPGYKWHITEGYKIVGYVEFIEKQNT